MALAFQYLALEQADFGKEFLIDFVRANLGGVIYYHEEQNDGAKTT